ncbi:YdeI/OmpD-associated family protein [Paenibacillus arenilitoris]|uniref:DUF1905 domain-containing protein n=1 Tax=Paenibacillus arenilitoris TaxID=2772299 RepID=A0A927CN55_9BACL|nr:YdeI/OmpD-associated family protein [Paenibacillus arenilitoris]MBD2871138.1 DUF1905 domain-containing protein [Paenibacillus arenilitoris]
MKEYRFQAVIQKHEGMDAAYILFPYNVEEQFGTRGQVKVRAVFDGAAEYRGSLANMGMDAHCLGIPRKLRQQLGKQPGDVVQVLLSEDNEPREVTVPEPFLQELLKHGAWDRYEALSYSSRKKLADSISGAKKPETMAKRMEAAIRSLTE